MKETLRLIETLKVNDFQCIALVDTCKNYMSKNKVLIIHSLDYRLNDEITE